MEKLIQPTYENLTEGQTLVDEADDRWILKNINKTGVPATWGYTIMGEKINLQRTRPLAEIERYYKIAQCESYGSCGDIPMLNCPALPIIRSLLRLLSCLE